MIRWTTVICSALMARPSSTFCSRVNDVSFKMRCRRTSFVFIN